MGARDLLLELASAGFSVAVEGDRLIVRPASKLTDDLRAQLRAAKPELLALNASVDLAAQAFAPLAEPRAQRDRALPATEATVPPHRPHALSPQLAEVAHAAPWDDDAVARFDARMAALLRRGYGTENAEDLAQRLHVRDIDCDDRRACIECSHCGETGRCLAAARRRPTNAGVDLHRLHRCPSFGLRKGLA